MDRLEAQRCAAVLYDGGWRAGDKEDMKREYVDFTEECVELVCEYLAEMEK